VALYFVLLIPVFLLFELAFRIWAIGFSLFDPAGRVRRFNTLTRSCGILLTRMTMGLLNARVEVVGEVPPGRFVIVSNHQSTADITILFWVFAAKNCKFVAKRQLGRWIPTVSVSIREGGFGLIGREPSRADLKVLREMARRLEHWDACAVIFAEGTRSRDGQLLPYRSAAVRIVARESGLPLLPVAIDGTHVAADLPGFARHMPGGRARVTIGEPIPPEDCAGRFDEAVEGIRVWALEAIEAGRKDGSVPPPT
jgi:1-acyl-sn-glycerol-3-phosphate acyltransferase